MNVLLKPLSELTQSATQTQNVPVSVQIAAPVQWIFLLITHSQEQGNHPTTSMSNGDIENPWEAVLTPNTLKQVL